MKRLPRWMQDLAHTADGLFVVDSRQRIALWNEGVEKLLGHARDDVIGRRCHDIISGRTCSGKVRCRPACQVQRVIRAHRIPLSFDVKVRRKDGAQVLANVSILSFYRRGRPHTVHLMRDATVQEGYRLALLAIRRALETAGPPKPVEPEGGRQFMAESPGAAPLSRLTAREVEILSLVATGLSTTAIANHLGISFYTVRNHVQNALQKLGLHTKAQAVSYAYKNGLL